ncbi:epoxyqueuosine reductase QueH [Patescibacteria group bacterium]|nr:epoxyqueuosine reductase QueH [Patescibacteria group bacterium]
MPKEKLLLHICCATCSAFTLQKLQKDFDVTAYYYNPNIYPADEYQQRFKESKEFCEQHNIPFTEENPDQDRWFLLTQGHENDEEKGDRCTICYKIRLEKTAQYAKEHGYDIFGTDLSISPHKDAKRLNKIGRELAQVYGLKFLVADFKKNDGYKQAMELSKQQGFYRQDYCGCLFSMKRRKSNDQV